MMLTKYPTSTLTENFNLSCNLDAILIASCARGSEIQNPASDSSITLIRSFKGKGVIRLVNGVFLFIGDNDLYFCKTRDIVSLQSDDDVWEVSIVCFSCANYELTENVKFTHPVAAKEKTDFFEIQGLLQTSSYQSRSLAAAILSTLIHRYICDFGNSYLVKYDINKAIAYIHDNINQNITIDDLAKKMCLSERQFRTIFKEHVGESPKKYIADARLDAARDMLISTNYTISQISELFGYSNQFYFSKAFAKKFGCPPSAMREI